MERGLGKEEFFPSLLSSIPSPRADYAERKKKSLRMCHPQSPLILATDYREVPGEEVIIRCVTWQYVYILLRLQAGNGNTFLSQRISSVEVKRLSLYVY